MAKKLIIYKAVDILGPNWPMLECAFNSSIPNKMIFCKIRLLFYLTGTGSINISTFDIALVYIFPLHRQ